MSRLLCRLTREDFIDNANPVATQSIIPKRIPYGISDFGRMQRENAYYVDKTHYIPLIEAAPFYLFCIRPRRMGKSLWLSILQHYYDVNRADEFDELFGDTYIGQNPTTERNSYLIIFLNFAMVNPALDKVEKSFESNGRDEIDSFLRRYAQFFSEDETQHIASGQNLETKLRRIFYYATEKRLKIYLLIDEYDNFTNTILTTEGKSAYHDLTHGTGFFRHFFNLLKGTTGGQITGLTRLFITGVSPVTMDDVTSGFNIGRNISLNARFNEMVGFTEAEVRSLLEHYRDGEWLRLPIEPTMELMKVWYGNYRFGQRANTSMFNSDMVLYFLDEAYEQTLLPTALIDENVRIDYGKLRHLMSVDKRLNGNFSQLQRIVETGETVSNINLSFPLEELTERENFISLLYYFGLLSIDGSVEGQPRLRIPNRTIKDLMYGYIRRGFRDVDVFRLDMLKLSDLMRDMAYRGQWRPFFEYLNTQIQEQASVRDHLNGEKVIQGFLIAYLNITHYFLTWSEREMGGGFVDLYLEPFLLQYPEMKYGYLIELEYISATQFNDKKFDKSLQQEIHEATKQLTQYANDPRIQQVTEQVPVKKVALIYKGWELVYAEEIES
ncbi:MAG: AAA family ATPase [Chloroflexota bacterium]